VNLNIKQVESSDMFAEDEFIFLEMILDYAASF